MGLWTVSGAFLFLWENFSAQLFAFKNFVGSVGLSRSQVLKCQWPCHKVSYLQTGRVACFWNKYRFELHFLKIHRFVIPIALIGTNAPELKLQLGIFNFSPRFEKYM